MTKNTVTTLGAVLVAACMSAPVGAGIHIEIPVEFVATTTPVYHGGHAAYWYGGRWVYRDGREWREYHEEPSHLREYRQHHEQERRYYGRRHDERR
jgi:hypothetical protein